MAKFDDKNGGRLSGLLGGLVIADKQVRTRPRKRKPGEWSEAQKAQRTRYSAVIELYRRLKDILVQPVWSHSTTKGITAYNLFLGANLHAFDTDGKIKDPTMLKMSIGELPRPYNMEAIIDASDFSRLKIIWENDVSINSDRKQDHLVAMFFNGTNFTVPISTDFLRKDKSASLEIPEGFNSGSYVFIFFGNREKNAYCESWVGRI